MAQRLKCLPPMRETWVRSLGREDPLEKEMATHSSILAWRIPWTEEPGRLQSTGSQRVGHIDMNPPQVYTCSPSLLPPHTIPLGHLSAPAPSIQYHALNLDWQFVSHMILYRFQCHSPKSCHPLPLPQSPKDCSIHLCLFCCLACRVIITIFLNSIYMC